MNKDVQNQVVITTSGTYQWSLVRQISVTVNQVMVATVKLLK